MPEVIPDKVYFRIGEVSEIVGVDTHVLRFWESEFPQLKPTRAESGQRLYRRRDVESFLEVKRLLHDERYTIAGAKKRLSSRIEKRESPQRSRSGVLLQVKEGLLEIRRMLDAG